MEANKILSADILDLVFEGRNKEYGAYELRKTYNKRLTIAIGGMVALLILLFLGYFLANTISSNDKTEMVVQDVQLEDLQEEKKPEPPPPPPPKPPEPPKVEMAKFTPPKIVKDEEVKEEEKPPEIEKLEEVKIGTTNQEGVKDEGIVAPPVDDGKGVVEAPKKDDEDWDKTFTKVEIESEFPGGMSAWSRYLNRNLRMNRRSVFFHSLFLNNAQYLQCRRFSIPNMTSAVTTWAGYMASFRECRAQTLA